MSYTINHYNGTLITVVADGTIDSSLSVKLIGKNYAGYGEVQNENMVYMLENFSSSTSPNNPLTGQIWFDSGNSKLKFWDGSKYRVAGGAESSATAPVGATIGDLWYNSTNSQVYVWNGTSYLLVGPQGVPGSGTTQMQSLAVIDATGGAHSIIQAVTNGQVVYIISPDQFTLNSTLNPISGFSTVFKGITLVNCEVNAQGQVDTSTSDQKFWGTASNADNLGGFPASAYLKTGAAGFSQRVQFSDYGYYLGNNRQILFDIEGNIPVMTNTQGPQIYFKTTVGSATVTPMYLNGADILPGTTNTSNIGSNALVYNTIYASSFQGVASQSNAVLETVSGLFRSGNTGVAANTVAVRDSNANINANIFNGVASSADYADLAEKYLPDAEYAPGTVMKIGGAAEVTAASFGDFPIGVVSTNPAYMMNKSLVGGIYIALKGRVPVLIKGPVSKGDQLISSGSGYGRADPEPSGNRVFAVSLQDDDSEGIRLVECLVL